MVCGTGCDVRLGVVCETDMRYETFVWYDAGCLSIFRKLF